MVTHTVWCQWDDLTIPSGWTITNADLNTISAIDLSKISLYVPLYLGGAKALSHSEKMPNLRLLQLLMAGYEDALVYMRNGQQLANARGVHDFSTAELAISMVLAHFKNHKEFAENQKNSQWIHRTTGSLYRKKVAIIGAGSVGTKLATMLSVFETTTQLYASHARENIKSIEDLNKDASTYDCIVVIVPLTDKTRNLVDTKILKAMKDGSLLVNVARGPVVNTNDLLAELSKGRISAALDVTDPEPLPADHPLWKLSNCQIIPHVGGDSEAFEPQARKFLEQQFKDIADGKPLRNEIDWKNS
jgi:phosphoglycerate dehydrogenase-like enzyme